MNSPEREKRPLYGIQLWLIDFKTGEKKRWIGDYSSGFIEDEVLKKDSLPELKEPEDPKAAKGY